MKLTALLTIFTFLSLGFLNSAYSQSCTPVDGGWSKWSGCNESCYKQRLCNNPEPSCGGSLCSGTSIVSCNYGACANCGDGICSTAEDNTKCSQDCNEETVNSGDLQSTTSGSMTSSGSKLLTGTGSTCSDNYCLEDSIITIPDLVGVVENSPSGINFQIIAICLLFQFSILGIVLISLVKLKIYKLDER